jgi:aspartyl-tRNA(Asn)/glutamyl-tRNA(Gln) amidotransferase subunit A
MSEAISAGRVSPVALVDAYLTRIAEENDKLHAYVDVYAQDARLAAEAADKARRSGHAVGPLHGIPIAVKDLVEIDGRITTHGCQVWRQRRSTYTATLARRLIERGVIVLGKTHMVEFAFGGWGTNSRMGTPRNPWDINVARVPGGSSSGSGVAVAAELAPWAVGTDTGGSVRLPASWCGLTGLKVSRGRISTYGVLPLSPTLDTPGPMAHSARDAALLYTAMQGADPHDPHTAGLPIEHGLENEAQGIAGMRLARLPDAERDSVATEVMEAYERSLDELADLGAEITTIDLPVAFADIATLNGQIMAAESYALFADLVDDETQALDEDVRSRVLAGRDMSAYAYLSALARRQQLTEQLDRAMDSIDAILTPTTISTALPLDEVDQASTPAHFTRFANFFNLCALALPNGLDSQGLPTSLQVIGHRHGEASVLRIGCAYQSRTSWHLNRPRPD